MNTSRILIIDDDPGLRKTLADILRVKGYEILVAGDATEGLALLGENSVGLALIDLGLPDMPGLEVLNRVKAGHPSTEAIILTGNATIGSAIEATNRGAFSYLLKPYDIDQLMLQVRRAFEKRQDEEKITTHSKELQKINAELKALYGISRAISRTIDLDKLLSEILQALAETEIFTFKIKGAVFLVEEDSVRLGSFVSISEAELEPCRNIRSKECLCGLAVETGEVVISKNSHKDSRHHICNPAAPPHGHVIVPLKAADKVVGLLNLYTEPEAEVSDETVKLLSSIGAQVGVAISNARLYEETKDSSLHDPLTGLANRRFMEIQLEKSIERAKRYGEELSLIMLDIDHFKKYNDTYGHPEGDRLLTELAGILTKEVRKADYVFRYGGEEFLVILPETGPETACKAAERLRIAVESEAGATISLGVASLTDVLRDRQALVSAADSALYRAKKNGRNRVETACG